jgi:hypothetical protein
LAGPQSRCFWLEVRQGKLTSGNPQSLFTTLDERFTFDVSNARIAVNVACNGAIQGWTAYRGCYPVDDIPGVWWHKDYARVGPLSFSLTLDGVTTDLADITSELRTGLLGLAIPRTEIDFGPLHLTLVSFAPVSADGTLRPGASFYGLLLANRSERMVAGSIGLPRPRAETGRGGPDVNAESLQISIARADGAEQTAEIAFSLAPGEELWTPTVIAASPAADALAALGGRTALEWLEETLAYYRSLTGTLETPDDPFLGEYIARCVHQCLHAFGMAADGELVGSNWGSFPITDRIWMKDMYYSALPLMLFDPDMARRTIMWFLDRSVRPARVGPPRKFKGAEIISGVTHSLSNALTPVLLAGQYYEATGDAAFFADTPHLVSRLVEIIEAVRHSKASDSPLYPSAWISDGRSLGDFHTGSNLVTWSALHGLARILREIRHEDGIAETYEREAEMLRAAIDHHCTTATEDGRVFVEGSFADGRVLEGHDGEESDITLMPFYGYRDFDDADYKRSMQHAISAANPWYVPETRGLKWSENPGNPESPTWTDSTFPGYTTGFASVAGADGMSGPESPMTQIKRLTDMDGSNWWWAYRPGAKFGDVTRALTGKCGWAAGVFVGLFVSQILGLNYDAGARTLSLRPFSPSSSFDWKGARLGAARFDVAFARGENGAAVHVTNQGRFAFDLAWELPAAEDRPVRVNGVEQAHGNGRFMGRPTVTGTLRLEPGAAAAIDTRPLA